MEVGLEFNIEASEQLQSITNNKEYFKIIILWGDQGTGKTYVAKNILDRNGINTYDIIFSTESLFPLGSFSYEEWLNSNKYNILEKYTKILISGECIIFQNMEKCGPDYNQLIFQLLHFHKINNTPSIVILEYNVTDKPDDKICSLANYYVRVKEKNDSFHKYLQLCFTYKPENELLFSEIVKMSNKNIATFFSILAILEKINVISVDTNGKYEIKNHDFFMPKNILILYIHLLNLLEDNWKKPLSSSAPFSMCIYENLLHTLFHQYDELKKYLNILSEDFGLLSNNNENECISDDLFKTTYSFSTSTARDAVLSTLDNQYKTKKLSDFYNYFLRIYNNKSWFNELGQTDKILLLYNLAKIRKNPLNINQIKYITELISYYYDNFMYLSAIEEASNLISTNVLNPIQLNNEVPVFWHLYFKSLLAVGDYDSIIKYKDIFNDNNLEYYIALAMYRTGKPLVALNYLNSIADGNPSIIGYKYSLLASIYDWIGNNKKSKYFFSKALSKCYKDENLKYRLYKNYGMYIDLRIEECKNKIEEAINYYKCKNLKIYAECLHNYGTGCIFIFNYDIANCKLEESINVFNKICLNEIYYPMNSLAILKCYSESNYETAITIWEEALQYNINEKFCKLAILNNMFNIYICMNKIEIAKQKMKEIQNIFLSDCVHLDDISKQRPDIQHQLRQYFYNCGILYRKEKKYKKSLEAFIKAKKSSSYNSIVTYSIDCYVKELSKVLRKKMPSFNKQKKLYPTPTEKFIYDKQMYLCEIMFWD